ncbi:MAG: hypothetical protein QNJ94_13345 [Alphaproteobacteria bacterium]|nr:hypothetical protein [Alphaproteobacteria bacterium]
MVMLGLMWLSPAHGAGSYTFSGLRWGSSPEEAAKTLREKGFKISKPKTGPATEYARMDAWLDIREVDRGKRMRATGKYLGEKVFVDMVFGFNNQLERINVRTAMWDQTQKGGKRMTEVADKLSTHFEQEFGIPRDKATPYGFVDTAEWGSAGDGSGMELFIRGTEGFMFYPPHKTVLNISFWNDQYGSDAAAIASTSSGGEAYPVSHQVDLDGSNR